MRFSPAQRGVAERSSLLWRALLLIVLFLPVPATAHGETGEPVALISRRPTLFHVAAAASLSFTVDPGQSKYAELLLESSAPGTEYVLLAPGGGQLRSVHADYPEWVVISFPLTGRGPYRLVTRSQSLQHDASCVVFRAAVLPFASAGATIHAQAEAFFSSAQTLSRSPKAAGLRQAIALYRQAGASWAATGEREGQMLALAGEAMALLGLSEHDQAIAALNRAAGIGAFMPYWNPWLANLQSQVYLDRWDHEPAAKSAGVALQLSGGLQDEWLIADALADRGEAEYWTRNPSATTDLEESLRLARGSNALATMARALRSKAWIEKDQGQLTHAFALLDQAREYFHQTGNVRAEMQAMSTLATIENISGDLYSTLLKHAKLAALMRDTGYAAHYAVVLDNIGTDYEELNRIPDAIVYYDQALVAYKSTHHVSGEAIALFNLCSAEMQENKLKDSLRDCRTAVALVEQFHDPKRLATSIWKLGTVQHALGQTGLAADSFRRAVELSYSVQDRFTEARALLDWGDMLESLGKTEEARKLFERALPLSQIAEDLPEQIEARYRIARSEYEAGRDDDARRDLKVALDSVQASRRAVGNADLQASYFAQMHKCHELFVELLMHEQGRDPSSESAAQALEVSESGRALTLLDALAARDGNLASRPQAGVSQELMELHMAVERAYDQRLKLMLGDARKRDMDANAAELTQAVDSLERAEDERAEDQQKTPAAGSFVPAGRTLSASEIVAASRNLHSTLVEYALGTEHSYVWVIENGKIESHVLPGRDSIQSEVKRWRELATARILRPGESFDDQRRRVEAADRDLPHVAANLSCMLLAPWLSPRMEHLTIVPDGDLDILPFEALPEDGCQGAGQPLVTDRQIVLTPSLSVLLARHEPSRQASLHGDVAILADPVFDRDDPRVHRTRDSFAGNHLAPLVPVLPRLLGTRDEAKAIAGLAGPGRATLYLDFDANLQTFLSPSLNQYRILHLAAHGVLDQNMSGSSGIVFSLVDQEGQPVFGYLKTHDIANLDLHPDLVVLSSCGSGAGTNLSGEGITGLAYAFLRAGARQVASTLWDVDDDVTKELMIPFYKEMYSAGRDPAEALRQSQILMMQSPHRSAPYYWAGFEITSVGN